MSSQSLRYIRVTQSLRLARDLDDPFMSGRGDPNTTGPQCNTVTSTGKASYSFSSYSVVLGAVAGDEVKSRQVWQPLPHTAPHHGNQQRFSAGAVVSTDGIDAPYSCGHVVSERHLGSR